MRQEPRAVVLVEGVSDQRAVEALSRRAGRDLGQERVAVVALGGVTNLGHAVRHFGPGGLGVTLAGLCDSGELRYVARVLERAGLGRDLDEEGLARLGFFSCVADLEDELVRALGPRAVEEVVEAEGDLPALRTLQQQPEQRQRSTQDQLRRFFGSGSGRKIRYAPLLVDALDLRRVPVGLAAVLDQV